MSNPISKLLLLAICSVSAANALADGSQDPVAAALCAGASSNMCSQLQAQIGGLNAYAPPQPFLNTSAGLTVTAGAGQGSSTPGVILQDPQKGSSDKYTDDPNFQLN